jgi:CRISPR system Cascade subunit CasD
MSDEPAHLALMLDAPLMSWGFASRFTRRTTALHPTRSALTGMICAAAGAAKGSADEKTWLERLHAVRLSVLTIPRRTAGGGPELPIRRLEDYHVTGGGYDRKTQAGSIPRKASGGPCDNPTVSWRHYLQDARFGIILAGPAPVLRDVARALRDPRWGVWFGRKNCIPAAPLVRGEVARGRDTAMASLGLAGRSPEDFDRVEDAPSFADGVDTVMDMPVSFAAREFKPRRILRRPRRGNGGSDAGLRAPAP